MFRNLIIFCLLLMILSSPVVLAQTDHPVSVDRGDPQRSGVYSSTAVAAPSGKGWQSDKLFTMLRTSLVSGGPSWNYSRGDPPFLVTGGARSDSYEYFYLTPVVSDGVIYFSLYLGDGHFFAVDASTGKLKWKSTRKLDWFTAPAIKDGTLYLGSSGKFFAVDLVTQRELWSFDFPGRLGAHTTPLIINDLVYFGSLSGNFYALDRASGKPKWQFNAGRNGGWARPVFAAGKVISAQWGGSIYAWDAVTGKETWKVALKKGAFSLMISGDTLYYVSEEGYLNALDVANGSERAGFRKGNRTENHLAAWRGKVLYGGWDAGGVFAVDASTGERIWKYDNGLGCNEPALAGGVIYLTCRDQKVYAVDANSGKKLWSSDTKQADMSAPFVTGGALYFIADDGKVHSLK